jgi:uncharacterized protein (TIGR04255 family)
MKLPVKLANVPIVEAVFEIRFKAAVPTSSVLPGLFFTSLAGSKTFQRLPAAEIPEVMRNADPNLQYAPLVALTWNEKYSIQIGDRSLGVACKLPYPGWSEFKKQILELVKVVTEANVLTSVERCSLKYTNIIPSDLGSLPDIAAIDLKIGTQEAHRGHLQIRADLLDGEAIHIVQIVSEGTTTLIGGRSITGVVIDVDTVRNFESVKPADFADQLLNSIDDLHTKTKRVFFSCLKPQALEKLGPTYA